MQALKLFIADDSLEIRNTLIVTAPQHRPDVVIIDFQIPGGAMADEEEVRRACVSANLAASTCLSPR